jgi:hypothetical protein
VKKIEQQMVNAIYNKQSWASGNTKVWRGDKSCNVWLHNNHIADVYDDGRIVINEYTLSRWPTNTTKSRLRALGANVYQKNNRIYYNDREIGQ